MASESESESKSRIKSCNRGHWRPAEDERLVQLVKMYGPQSWNFIAQHLDRRSGKSCRLRWYNQLDPSIIKKPFTEEEEEMLVALHKVKGNKWAAIARYFPGRTDNAVKNHFHVLMARRKREGLSLLNDYAISDSISRNTYSGVFNLQNKSASASASASGGVMPQKEESSANYCCTPPASFMLGSYQSFTAPEVPSIGKLVPIPCKLSESSKQEQHRQSQSLEHKSIPFIDFLGVGTSSAN